MGYALIYGPCFGCKRLFTYNPHKVPSLRWEGVRQPICLTCIQEANLKRAIAGIPPLEVHPDAYEPCEESEL